MALCTNSQHISVNGVWLDVFRVKIAVRVIYHVTQILGSSPAPPCLIQVTEAVVVDYILMVYNCENCLRLNGYSGTVCQSYLVVMLQQQIASDFLYAHCFLNAKASVFNRHIVTYRKHARICVAAKRLQEIQSVKRKGILRLYLACILEIIAASIPQIFFCSFLILFGQIYVCDFVSVANLYEE